MMLLMISSAAVEADRCVYYRKWVLSSTQIGFPTQAFVPWDLVSKSFRVPDKYLISSEV